jgi:hypothetical protein
MPLLFCMLSFNINSLLHRQAARHYSSSACEVTVYRLYGEGLICSRVRDCFLSQHVLTISDACPTSFLLSAGGLFHRGWNF